MRESAGPIFVGGTGRSGTKLVGTILNAHPDVLRVAPENKLIAEPFGLIGLHANLADRWGSIEAHQAVSNFVFFARQLRRNGFHNPILRALAPLIGQERERALVRRFPRIRYSVHAIGEQFGLEHYDACIEQLVSSVVARTDLSRPLESYGVLFPYYLVRRFNRSRLTELLRRFLDELYRVPLASAGKSRWCDDTPRNLGRVDFLLELFPESKFVHVFRDPRDVVSSYSTVSWGTSSIDSNIRLVTNFILSWVELRKRLPAGSFIELRLEDLVVDPYSVVSQLCDFLGLPFSENMLRFDFTRGHVGRFREDLTERHRAEIERKLRGWMLEKRYLAD